MFEKYDLAFMYVLDACVQMAQKEGKENGDYMLKFLYKTFSERCKITEMPFRPVYVYASTFVKVEQICLF